MPGDWTKALFIFENCLVDSAGRTLHVVAESIKAGLNPLEMASRNPSQRYDDRLATDADQNLDNLIAQDKANWIVWPADVVQWDLRAGILASRSRFELADGTRHKVLWGRISNSLPPIRSALDRVLGSSCTR